MKIPSQDLIDAFVTDLRAVSAPPFTSPVKSTSRRRTARILTPAFLAAGALAGIVCLRPQPALGAGWETILAKTAGAPSRHVRQYEPDGRMSYEMWRVPGRLAFWYAPRWVKAGGERVISELRFDGRRQYQLNDENQYPSVRLALNSRVFGTVRTKTKNAGSDLADPSPDFDHFVTAVGGEVTEVREGDRIAYRVRQKKAHRVYSGLKEWRWVQDTYLVRIDNQRRIAETVMEDGTRIVYDYPSEIPVTVFEPRPQKRIVPVIDIDRARAIARQRICTGSGTKNGITLRLVFMDRRGELWILWSGILPNGSLRPHARLIGILTGTAYGPKELTSDSGLTLRQSAVPGLGFRLGGHALTPTAKIGDRISLAIPSPKGTATFRDVPVLRVGNYEDLREEIGLGPIKTRVIAKPGK